MATRGRGLCGRLQALVQQPGNPFRVVVSDKLRAEVLISDRQGNVSAEYVVVLGVVGLLVAAATAALGLPLYRLFVHQQAWLLMPIP